MQLSQNNFKNKKSEYPEGYSDGPSIIIGLRKIQSFQCFAGRQQEVPQKGKYKSKDFLKIYGLQDIIIEYKYGNHFNRREKLCHMKNYHPLRYIM